MTPGATGELRLSKDSLTITSAVTIPEAAAIPRIISGVFCCGEAVVFAFVIVVNFYQINEHIAVIITKFEPQFLFFCWWFWVVVCPSRPTLVSSKKLAFTFGEAFTFPLASSSSVPVP